MADHGNIQSFIISPSVTHLGVRETPEAYGARAEPVVRDVPPTKPLCAEAQQLKNEAIEAFRKHQLAEAVILLSEAIELEPESPLLRSNRAHVLAAAQNFHRALSDADEVIRLAPNWSKGYARRAHALESLRNYPAALVTYTDAFEAVGYPEALVRQYGATLTTLRTLGRMPDGHPLSSIPADIAATCGVPRAPSIAPNTPTPQAPPVDDQRASPPQSARSSRDAPGTPQSVHTEEPHAPAGTRPRRSTNPRSPVVPRGGKAAPARAAPDGRPANQPIHVSHSGHGGGSSGLPSPAAVARRDAAARPAGAAARPAGGGIHAAHRGGPSSNPRTPTAAAVHGAPRAAAPRASRDAQPTQPPTPSASAVADAAVASIHGSSADFSSATHAPRLFEPAFVGSMATGGSSGVMDVGASPTGALGASGDSFAVGTAEPLRGFGSEHLLPTTTPRDHTVTATALSQAFTTRTSQSYDPSGSVTVDDAYIPHPQASARQHPHGTVSNISFGTDAYNLGRGLSGEMVVAAVPSPPPPPAAATVSVESPPSARGAARSPPRAAGGAMSAAAGGAQTHGAGQAAPAPAQQHGHHQRPPAEHIAAAWGADPSGAAGAHSAAGTSRGAAAAAAAAAAATAGPARPFDPVSAPPPRRGPAVSLSTSGPSSGAAVHSGHGYGGVVSPTAGSDMAQTSGPTRGAGGVARRRAGSDPADAGHPLSPSGGGHSVPATSGVQRSVPLRKAPGHRPGRLSINPTPAGASAQPNSVHASHLDEYIASSSGPPPPRALPRTMSMAVDGMAAAAARTSAADAMRDLSRVGGGAWRPRGASAQRNGASRAVVSSGRDTTTPELSPNTDDPVARARARVRAYRVGGGALAGLPAGPFSLEPDAPYRAKLSAAGSVGGGPRTTPSSGATAGPSRRGASPDVTSPVLPPHTRTRFLSPTGGPAPPSTSAAGSAARRRTQVDFAEPSGGVLRPDAPPRPRRRPFTMSLPADSAARAGAGAVRRTSAVGGGEGGDASDGEGVHATHRATRRSVSREPAARAWRAERRMSGSGGITAGVSTPTGTPPLTSPVQHTAGGGHPQAQRPRSPQASGPTAANHHPRIFVHPAPAPSGAAPAPSTAHPAAHARSTSWGGPRGATRASVPLTHPSNGSSSPLRGATPSLHAVPAAPSSTPAYHTAPPSAPLSGSYPPSMPLHAAVPGHAAPAPGHAAAAPTGAPLSQSADPHRSPPRNAAGPARPPATAPQPTRSWPPTTTAAPHPPPRQPSPPPYYAAAVHPHVAPPGAVAAAAAPSHGGAHPHARMVNAAALSLGGGGGGGGGEVAVHDPTWQPSPQQPLMRRDSQQVAYTTHSAHVGHVAHGAHAAVYHYPASTPAISHQSSGSGMSPDRRVSSNHMGHVATNGAHAQHPPSSHAVHHPQQGQRVWRDQLPIR